MRRLVPGIAIPVLMGVPVLMEPSSPVAVLALASGALCLIAVLRMSLAWATAGGAIALLALAVALEQSSLSGNALVLTVFGLALLLLVDGTHLCHRFDGAEVTRALWRRLTVWWTARAAISLGIAIVIAIVAPLIAIGLPPSWAPFLAGIGILAAFAAAVAFAWPSVDD
jgi:hypothetical protein